MAIVQSYGVLTATRDDRPAVYTGAGNIDVPSYGWSSAYATIYATQPAVRTCVDFLARNIAQLGLHVFRRVSDTDRVRLTKHPIADWIKTPNPYTTRYRLIESLIGDLAIYFNSYLLKIRLATGRIGMVRIPAGEMHVVGGLLPQQFIWTVDGQEVPVETTEIIYANGYNPLNALMGLSPLETLRQILVNEAAATDHRARYWRNASRMEGVIERPATAPKWQPAQKQAWREQWQARYTGPQSAGQTPVLEDGMTWRPISWSAKDSEYTSARKLTREEVAAAYHIPLPMVGILDHATFSNIKEQHKQLYSDCLGPWLKMLEGALDLQLVPEAADSTDVYVEFNFAEKLKGSFEEQSNALRVAVGRPFMTANEARARLNLPRLTEDASADQLAAQQGGPAAAPVDPEAERLPPATEDGTQAATATVVRAHLHRQASHFARLPREARAEALRQERVRWATELADDLHGIVGRAPATAYAALITDHTYALLCDGIDAFNTTDREVPYVW
jgi:HK97 family phage portal protein